MACVPFGSYSDSNVNDFYNLYIYIAKAHFLGN